MLRSFMLAKDTNLSRKNQPSAKVQSFEDNTATWQFLAVGRGKVRIGWCLISCLIFHVNVWHTSGSGRNFSSSSRPTSIPLSSWSSLRMKFHNHFTLKSYTVLIAKHTAEMLKSKINLDIIHCASIALCLYGHTHATSNHRKQNQERGSKSDLLQLTIRKKLQKGTRKKKNYSFWNLPYTNRHRCCSKIVTLLLARRADYQDLQLALSSFRRIFP